MQKAGFLITRLIFVSVNVTEFHLSGQSCSLAPCVCLFVILVISHLGFDGRILTMIVPVPGNLSLKRLDNFGWGKEI